MFNNYPKTIAEMFCQTYAFDPKFDIELRKEAYQHEALYTQYHRESGFTS